MDTLDVIMLVGMALVVGWYAGWIARGVVIITNLARNPEYMIRLLEEIRTINQQEEQEGTETTQGTQRPRTGTAVRAEQLKGLTYLYTLEKDEFVGQGESIHDALVQARERFPNKTFWLDTSKQDNHTA